MAGYTRQSVADIIANAVIKAAPVNAEFNAIRDAFNNSTGHKHDGTSSEGSYVPLIADLDGQNKVVVDTVNNRISVYTEVSGVATEQLRIQDGAIVPVTDDDIDLGTSSLEFKNLYLDGSAFIDTLAVHENATIAGTLGVTGLSILPTVNIDGGTIDGTSIGGTTATTGTFTTATAAAFVGPLTGDVVGNVTGNLTGDVSGDLTGDVTSTGASSFTTVDINGGAIDGTTVGATTASTITGTTITANTGFVGSITGDVTGDVTGNLTGDVTGDLTGNVTSSSGTSTFNDVTINGTLNMDAGTAGTITNLTNPTNAQDAATKAYVDSEVSALVDSAPGALDTLNELAAALGDDADFSTTITNSIATKLPLSGGTMSGNISMGSNTVTGLGTPTSATDATTKTYVDGILGSSTAASASAALAEAYANEDEDVEVEAGKYSAFHFSEKSSASATASSASATNAATSEGNASTFATNSANSATAASASATNAATSESNSATSASSSATSAANSATSATNASTSETNAATSATNAATSETNAATSASNASISETNAAASAATAEDAAIVFAIALG